MLYYVEILCFDNVEGSKPYIDTPAVNPLFYSNEEAFLYAKQLAEEEVNYLNGEGGTKPDDGVHFGIPEDFAYQTKISILVNQYFNPEGDFSGETNTVTMYRIKQKTNDVEKSGVSINFTAKINKDYCMINTAKFHLKNGGTVTIDRENTIFSIENGNLSMTWNEIFIWAINDECIFCQNTYPSYEIVKLLDGAWVEFDYEDEAVEDYQVSNIKWSILNKVSGTDISLVDLRVIYKKQLDFVTKIANDIIKYDASPKVIEYVSQYAHVENEYNEFWRVNWGEAYVYIDIDEDGKPLGTIDYSCEEMGIGEGLEVRSYEGVVNALEKMSLEEIYNKSEYTDCYNEYKDKKYELPYKHYMG